MIWNQYRIRILWSIIIVLSCIKSDAFNDTSLLINCGLPKSTRSESPLDGRVWQSDDNPAFAPSYLNTVSSNVSEDNADDLPYKVGRVFWSDITYIFSITPGPIFIRLYFFPNVSSNNTHPHLFSTSLVANNYTLLHNFNPFLNSLQKTTLQYEFHLILQNGENNLNLTFSPGGIINNNTRSSFGYINGIEIETIPEGLYINESNLNYLYVTYKYYLDHNSTAFQTAYRLNVGGENVDRNDDNPGGMKRKWEADEQYVVGARGVKFQPLAGMGSNLTVNYTEKTPPYVAPKIVYETFRMLGDRAPALNLGKNLTWSFQVDPGFDYVVRLLLREMSLNVTGIKERVMCVYIWAEAGGLGIPMYKDFVISMPDISNGSKVALSVALHPYLAYVTDVSLSGLEILKLSDPTRNLAVPNPPYNGTDDSTSLNQTPSHKSSIRKILFVIGGVIAGLLLVSVILLALFRRRLQYKKLFTSANTSRLSIQTDLCRRFSLTRIRVATHDFDQKLIIGRGGFGKVYKGCIDGGATDVAVKRLNSTSKQGSKSS